MGRLLVLAFAMGAAWLQTRPALPPLAWSALLPLAGLPFLVRPASAWFPGGARLAAAAVLAFATGFFYAAWRADLRLAEALPGAWEGRDIGLVGRVVGLPETTPSGLRFVFSVNRVSTPGAQVPERVQLGWYAQPGETLPALKGGDCLAVVARLHRPHANLNPGGFDYQAWLLERNIRAVGGLRGLPAAATGCTGDMEAALDRLRESIRANLRQALGDAPHAGVVVALAVGDQDAIPAAAWTLFRQTGTSHLFSVSGLHITLFSSLVFALVKGLWRRFPRLNLWVPARRAGILPGLAAAAAYGALAGFGIPAQRTVYMLAGAAAVALLDRTPTPTRLLAAALAGVTVLDPWAALAPGFWLSFAAVAALLHAMAGLDPDLPRWRGWLRAQWAVTLALTPLLLALFHEVSLVSPLANALAIPLISIVAVPLSLLASFSPWPWPAQAAHGVIVGVLACLDWLASLPQPVFHAASPSWPALFLAIAGAGVVLAPGRHPLRWFGLVLFLPLFFPSLPAPAPGRAWITVLDVGQGEAVLVRTARRALLVDGGPRYASGEDAGGRVVAPDLWRQGINRLDGLVVTHDDLDHSGGAGSLLASHHPAWLLSSLSGLPVESLGQTGRALMGASLPKIACAAGQTWVWDGVRFTVLHPPAHHYGQAGFKDNDRGCVLRVDAAGHGVLLAADIERLGEMNLLERKALLGAEVLVAPHHGSNTSSTPAFLAAVSPALVVVPVGYRNRYGHPHPEVLARYRALGARVLRTDRDGAITLGLDPAGLTVTRAVETERRYWRE